MFDKVPKSISFELGHIIFIIHIVLPWLFGIYFRILFIYHRKHRTKSNLGIQDKENYLTQPEISFFYTKWNEILLYSWKIFAKIRSKMWSQNSKFFTFLFSMFRTQGNNSIRLTPSEGISVLYEGPRDLNEFEVGDIRNYS